MYAILELGGRQYQVSVGQKIQVNRLQAAVENDPLPLKNVLYISGGAEVGAKALSGASVRAIVTRNFRGPKIRVYKTKRRTGFQKTRGHRQDLTELLITDIFPTAEDAEPASGDASPESASEAALDGAAAEVAATDRGSSEGEGAPAGEAPADGDAPLKDEGGE
ncbi:MAG: 50S ribosomal protein L21 [Deltaproteobacteria bacterium]|jgi:large subunit ribosomal protein L21|nr:50S ribosomal protein L21 [Deltaproteobacteria bacterium]